MNVAWSALAAVTTAPGDTDNGGSVPTMIATPPVYRHLVPFDAGGGGGAADTSGAGAGGGVSPGSGAGAGSGAADFFSVIAQTFLVVKVITTPPAAVHWSAPPLAGSSP